MTFNNRLSPDQRCGRSLQKAAERRVPARDVAQVAGGVIAFMVERVTVTDRVIASGAALLRSEEKVLPGVEATGALISLLSAGSRFGTAAAAVSSWRSLIQLPHPPNIRLASPG